MNKLFKAVLAVTFSLFCLAGCMPAGTEAPNENLNLIQLEGPQEGQEMAIVTTNKGIIKFVLYEEYAPNTVAQFKELVNEGFYNNNAIFSTQKEISGFLAGASDELGNEGKTTAEDGKGIDPETTPNIWHFPGAVSAIGDEEGLFIKEVKADSRFFILGDRPVDTDIVEQMEENQYPEEVIDAYKELGGMPGYTGKFTVFGQVIEGMDVVNEIINTETETDEEGKDTGVPKEELIIEKIEFSTYSAPEDGSGEPNDSSETTSEDEAA